MEECIKSACNLQLAIFTNVTKYVIYCTFQVNYNQNWSFSSPRNFHISPNTFCDRPRRYNRKISQDKVVRTLNCLLLTNKFFWIFLFVTSPSNMDFDLFEHPISTADCSSSMVSIPACCAEGSGFEAQRTKRANC